MAVTLAPTFTLIRCVSGSLFGDIWNFVGLVCVGKTLNCECEVKNPQNLYMVNLQLAMYYMSSHASAHYFLIRHGGVISPI